MGRNNKSYSKSIDQQAYEKLESMQAFGESRKAAKADGTASGKIFSYTTFRVYRNAVSRYLDWLRTAHPDCTTLAKARGFVSEWLAMEQTRGLSSWTINTYEAGLNKLFGITRKSPDRYLPPKERRSDIKRSRMPSSSDRSFSETRNIELVRFCRSTGLRRSEMGALRGGEFMTREEIEYFIFLLEHCTQRLLCSEEQETLSMLQDALLFPEDYRYFVYVRSGKGGRERLSPVIGKYRGSVIERIKSTPDAQNVWEHLHVHADIHAYRADYAMALYLENARKIEEIPYDKYHRGCKQWYQSEVYSLRRDAAGIKLDRRAMLLCSKALGHNRINVVAQHYLYGL